MFPYLMKEEEEEEKKRGAFSLMALTGNIGPRGSGVCDTSRFFAVDSDTLGRPDLAPEGTRELNVMDIPRYVLEPADETPLRALFIYNHNPVAVHPEQDRMREEESHRAPVVPMPWRCRAIASA